MHSNHPFFVLLMCLLTASLWGQQDNTDVNTVQIKDYTILAQGDQLFCQAAVSNGTAEMQVNGEPLSVNFANGQAPLRFETDEKGQLYLFKAGGAYRLYHIAKIRNGYRVRSIPFWLSILPPLIAIVLALIFREVIVSLFVGIWTGAFIAGGMRLGSLYYFVLSFVEVIQKYIINALNDSGHLSIIVFSLLIGGMVAIISRNGGMAGVVKALSRYARTSRSAQFITWLLGVAIFFDDYANTLIVGNTMRSVTDRFKISREKLAYIVDSTAAPVAAVAFITTWIGAELGYIDDGISQIADYGYTGPTAPYALFVSSLKYSFYPILTLAFILILIFTGRDFGKMYTAEKRARTTGVVSNRSTRLEEINDVENLDPVKGAPLSWHNAVIPVSAVILVTMFGLLDTGMTNTYSVLQEAGASLSSSSWGTVWSNISAVTTVENPGFFVKMGVLIGNADSYVALLWASLIGVFLAIALTVGGRIMFLADTITTMTTGLKTMLPAIMILTLAWSLASTTEELHTATYLTTALQDSLNPYLMPAIIFILAAAIAFSTGSSWSTMAILYPIAIPTTWAVCVAQGMDTDISMEILLNVIAVTLAASVLGDHCSPISDTTILSSLASDCNHIDHVRTQLPYALTVGGVSLLAGTLSTLLGGSWLVSTLLLIGSLALLWILVLRLGKKVEE